MARATELRVDRFRAGAGNAAECAERAFWRGGGEEPMRNQTTKSGWPTANFYYLESHQRGSDLLQ
eukprot:3663147-Alexandrium_andersonii.AAC.1